MTDYVTMLRIKKLEQQVSSLATQVRHLHNQVERLKMKRAGHV